MVIIPENKQTTAATILRWYSDQPDSHRQHLGFSIIGGPCDRQLWYGFHWASTAHLSGRIRRLFETGHLAEDRFLSNLRAIGVEVQEVDPETGEQFYYRSLGGHFGGSCDGIGKGFPEGPKTQAVVEFKTHSSKSFASLSKDGVQKSKPVHWAQMQCYMLSSNLTRALYLAVNKDTDDLYSEWIYYDRNAALGFVDRAKKVIEAKEPLTPVTTDFTWWECKMCDHFSVCHSNKVSDRNCRTCAFSTPDTSDTSDTEGRWICERFNRPLSPADQKAACQGHLFIPSLIPYGEPIDGGNDWVGYRHRANGTKFANISENCERDAVPAEFTAGYTSRELIEVNASVVADQLMTAIKDEFWGSQVTFIEDKT